MKDAKFEIKTLENELETKIRICRNTGRLALRHHELGELSKTFFEQISKGTVKERESKSEIKWWEIENLIKIDLSYCEVENIQSDTFEGLELQSLLLDGNKLTRVSEWIENLAHSLKVCFLSSNQISAFDIKKSFDQLLSLNLSHNKLCELPDLNKIFPNLTNLNLSDNQLKNIDKLPYTKLQQLNLSKNKFKSFPDQFFENLNELENLNLSQNEIHSISLNFGHLKQLIVLDLHQNLLDTISTKFPSETSTFKLDQLLLGFNNLKSLSDLFPILSSKVSGRYDTHFSNLTVLDVKENSLSYVDDGILLLKSIKVLDFRNNNLKEVSCYLGYMDSLNILKIEGNGLRNIRNVIISESRKLKEYLRCKDVHEGDLKKHLKPVESEITEANVKNVKMKVVLQDVKKVVKVKKAAEKENISVEGNSEKREETKKGEESEELIVLKKIADIEQNLEVNYNMNKFKKKELQRQLIHLRKDLNRLKFA